MYCFSYVLIKKSKSHKNFQATKHKKKMLQKNWKFRIKNKDKQHLKNFFFNVYLVTHAIFGFYGRYWHNYLLGTKYNDIDLHHNYTTRQNELLLLLLSRFYFRLNLSFEC